MTTSKPSYHWMLLVCLVVLSSCRLCGDRDHEATLIAVIKTSDRNLHGPITRRDANKAQKEKLHLGSNDPDAYEFLTTDNENKTRVRSETCEQYLAALEQGAFAFTTADITTESWYIRACGALKFLERAQPSKISSLGPNPFLKVSVEILGYWGSEEEKRIRGDAEKGLNLADYARSGALKIEIIDQTTIQFETLDKAYTIEELARGDWDGDGHEDSLIFMAWHYLEGSGRGYSLALIPGGQENLKAYQVKEFPPF